MKKKLCWQKNVDLTILISLQIMNFLKPCLSFKKKTLKVWNQYQSWKQQSKIMKLIQILMISQCSKMSSSHYLDMMKVFGSRISTFCLALLMPRLFSIPQLLPINQSRKLVLEPKMVHLYLMRQNKFWLFKNLRWTKKVFKLKILIFSLDSAMKSLKFL